MGWFEPRFLKEAVFNGSKDVVDFQSLPKGTDPLFKIDFVDDAASKTSQPINSLSLENFNHANPFLTDIIEWKLLSSADAVKRTY